EQIKQAPTEQSSKFGSGGGGSGGSEPGGVGGGGPGTTLPAAEPGVAPLPPISVPRVRHCIGHPPRQIEHSQSPPCVSYWQCHNGGATSKGVDRKSTRL